MVSAVESKRKDDVPLLMSRREAGTEEYQSPGGGPTIELKLAGLPGERNLEGGTWIWPMTRGDGDLVPWHELQPCKQKPKCQS